MHFKYAGWKKVKTEDHYTVMQNDKGDQLRINNKALSPKHRGELAALPIAMADGGEVKKEDAPVTINIGGQPQAPAALVNPAAGQAQLPNAPQFAAPQQMTPEAAAAAAPGGALPYGITPAMMAAGAPKGPQDAVAMSTLGQSGQPAPTPAVAPAGPSPDQPQATAQTPAAGAIPGLDQAGYEMTNAGLAKEAQVAATQGNAEAKALEAADRTRQELMTTWKKQTQDLDALHKDYMKAMIDKKIEPNQFWENKSVPNKILTIIGLALGGAGAGASGQQNLGAQMLQRQIDADIDAQKANIGQKNNLLKMNLDHFGNMRDATTMTRLMLNDAADMQIKKAAAQAKGPEAKARLMQLVGDRMTQQQAAVQKMAIMRAVDQVSNGENPEAANHVISALRQAGMTKEAEDLNSRYVPGLGVAREATDAKVLKESKGALDSTLNGINQLKAIISRPMKSFNPTDRAEAEVIEGQLKGPMRTALGLGILSEGDMKLLASMIANPTSLLSMDSSNRKRLDTLAQRMQDNFNTQARARGINIKPVSFTPAK